MSADDPGKSGSAAHPASTYRLAIHHAPDGSTTVTVEVDTQSEHGWVAADAWTSRPKTTAGEGPDDLATAQGTARGWGVVGPAVTVAPAIIHVPVAPADWRVVLLAATKYRADLQEAAAAADLAWQAIVSRTPRSQVGAIDIADMAGLGRHRIYQIQGVGVKPGRFPPAPT